MKADECGGLKLLVPDDEKVLNIFKGIRWADGVYCPKCCSKNVVKYGFVHKTPQRRYLCRECKKLFTDLTGTIFSNKQIPLGESFYIITQLDKKTIKRLAKELGDKWETINRLAKDFKKCLNSNTSDPYSLERLK
jgi:transposase-like protein